MSVSSVSRQINLSMSPLSVNNWGFVFISEHYLINVCEVGFIPLFLKTWRSVNRMLVFDVRHYSNGHYVRIGRTSTTRFMNVLEMHFLFGINFRLNITLDDFYSYVGFLQREMLFESPP
ncbi:hypothetical protein MRB53_010447 [Persea americana]|uniref:Uncharacterized protein n=1 Tax=Persea americana TaxID=3435 RepID=A0ACC2LRV3_PERAE|nr:hypothetical protein MRB53_010447 [Persea americana]